jgi:hypothetical protein
LLVRRPQLPVLLVSRRDPRALGAARAKAGRPLPTPLKLASDWGFAREERRQFALGYAEARCGTLAPSAAEAIERAYARMKH